MTTMAKEKLKCSVCGTENEYHVIMSTNSFGSPDLDLRPPEMQRSTMPLWIQECHKCGYVSNDISKKTKIKLEFLQSKEYLSCDGINFKSKLASRFYKYYMISLKNKKIKDAFFAVVHAAWACDDAEDFDNAKKCREIAVSLHSKLEQDENLSVMKMDLLRRSGQFEVLLNEYSSFKYSQDILNKIAKFEMQKAMEKDTSCYTVSEAIGK